MKAKADVLNIATRDRKKPQDFDEATLTYALYWLLSQCGVLDEHCRATCKELYVNVSQYAVGGSALETTRAFVEIYGTDRLHSIILGGLEPYAEDVSIGNIEILLKALDYYMWLIEKQLLPLDTLFPSDAPQEHVIFACIRNFSHRFLRTVVTTTMTKFEEFDKLQTLQCKAVTAILKFVQVLLNVNDVSSSLIA